MAAHSKSDKIMNYITIFVMRVVTLFWFGHVAIQLSVQCHSAWISDRQESLESPEEIKNGQHRNAQFKIQIGVY